MKLDTTTIDMEKLARRCREYTLPPTYRLQQAPGGNGCYLDPPGYPTYFTRRVYTQHGSSPARGPGMLLFGRAVPEYTGDGEAQWALWRAIYRPLPIDHPRVVEWMGNLLRQKANCYQIPKELSRSGRDTMMVWPLPGYELKKFVDDPRFSDEWRASARAEVETWNMERIEQLRPYSGVGHHRAVLAIREVYPDFSDEAAEKMIAAGSKLLSSWWERHDVPPLPGQCPGDREVSRTHKDEHCQFCGGHGNLPPATNTESQEG